jgi:hypothetical protein
MSKQAFRFFYEFNPNFIEAYLEHDLDYAMEYNQKYMSDDFLAVYCSC